MARLLAVVGLVIFLSIHWGGCAFFGQEPKNRLPTPESPQLSNLVIANYVLTASLIFSANTIKEATLAQTEELVTIKEATLAQTEELVTINKQLAAISAKIDSFGDSFGTTSEKAKSLIDDRYDTQQTMNFVVTVLALAALLFFVVSAIRRYFRM